MAGPELKIVGELAHLAQRLEERASGVLHGASDVRRTLEQVGTADVTHEDEISRERADRLVSAGGVGYEEDEMLRGVTGHVPRLDVNFAQREGIAVAKQLCALRGVEPVLPVRASFSRQKEA